MNYLLGCGLGGVSPFAKFYIAPFKGTGTVVATITGADFPLALEELTTQYEETTRVEFVESAPAAGGVNNTSSPAIFTAFEDNVNIWGVGLLSSLTKGNAGGKLLSVAKYAAIRNLPTKGDTLGVKYTLSLTNV